MSLLHKLQWRYATKQFDPEKKVSEEDVTELLKAANLTASSYGLQPYEILVIKNQELQDTLRPVSWNQSQLSDASHVLVIAAKTSLSHKDIDVYIQNIMHEREVSKESLDGYRQMMIDGPGSWSSDQVLDWAKRQCYIVLGTLLLAAADLKIDTCPMEGFDPAAYNDILDLEGKGLSATLVLPIGYRSVDDGMQHAKKVRKPLDQLIELKY